MNDKTREAAKKELAKIKTPEDFIKLFRLAYMAYIGSPKSCADQLTSLAPPDKKEIVEQAISQLRNQFPGRDWNYAGD